MKIFFITLIFIIGFEEIAFGQKQASIWYTGLGNGIDFSAKPYRVISNGPEDYDRYSTIADKDGNLLFYCNRNTVYNKHNAIIENGTDLDGTIGGEIFIFPRPGSETQFYIFQVKHDNKTSLNSKVLYSLVDMDANGGAGLVVFKNELLYTNLHGSITAGGNCEKGFWFVGETNTNVVIESDSDQIYAFKIDEHMVHRTPVISEPANMGHSYNYRLSPIGDKLFFGYGGNDNDDTALTDFDLETGEVKNFQKIGPPGGLGEFSADGRFLYVAYSESLLGLFQYDLTKPTLQPERISSISNIHQMQLAPNGKIYMLYNDGEVTKMAFINQPDLPGLACDIETEATFPFGNDSIPFYLPEFPSNLLYNGPDRIDAGPDLETCSGESIVIGGINDPSKEYEWFPTDHLDNPNKANPTFTYENPTDTIVTFNYRIKSCEFDIVKIRVFPRPGNRIYGSKSVCPGVELVDYWTEESFDSLTFQWSVDGGLIVEGQNTDSIKVNWGKTNPDAGVEVLINNQFNCPAGPIRFPVRINVQLQTETPIGDELLCSNMATGIPYKITNTNGSIYTWQTDFGNIITGQGSNQILVDWPWDGYYHLWVQEESTTIDTICYGVSDSLLVNLFTDSTLLEIDYTTISREDGNLYELEWNTSDTTRLTSNINIFTSNDISSEWVLSHVTNKEITHFSFPDTLMNYTPMSFKISAINGCQEIVESTFHTTVYLDGIADSSSNIMILNWTSYLGWGDNLKQYEIWYKNDNENQLSLVASLTPEHNEWSIDWGALAFDHYFRIKVTHNSYPFESMSNELVLSFDHQLEIPNVFTPNGDGINDTFNFRFLELFSQNELKIFDRSGKEVYSKDNYKGTWSGDNLASGVYFYSFTEKRNNKIYNGWLQILR